MELCQLKMMLWASMVLTGLATFLLLLAFSTSSWIVVQSDFEENPMCQLLNMGLWSFCFKNFRYPNAFYDRVYNKCYWIFSPELWDLQDYLLPSWFRAVQTFMTLSFLLMLASTIAITTRICGRGASLAFSGWVNVIVTIMIFLSLMLFGHFGHTLENWMPHPSENELGYSYGLLVGAGFLTLFGGVLALLYRSSERFVKDFRVEELKDIQAYLQGDFDVGSEYQFTESASRAQSRIEHFYGRSVSEKDAESQYSGNGMPVPMGRH